MLLLLLLLVLCCAASFVIQQVRTDPDAYPYLLTPSQGGFQECVANAANSSHPLTAVAVNCLTKLASDPLVQSLVADHVINVFVSITKNDTDYCTDPITRKPWPDRDAPPLCRVGLRLFDAAYGPWYTGVSKGTWDESDASKNFLFIHWELFDGAGLNRDDEHNAGVLRAVGASFLDSIVQAHLQPVTCLTPSYTPCCSWFPCTPWFRISLAHQVLWMCLLQHLSPGFPFSVACTLLVTNAAMWKAFPI